MTPRTEALAYRIHCYAAPRGWDVTATEIAEAISTEDDVVPWRTVVNVMRGKKWLDRIRKGISRHQFMEAKRGDVRYSVDHNLDGGSYDDVINGLLK